MTPLRVLLVEHDEVDVALVTNAVTRLDPDARVDVATTRKEFTELLARHEYSIVLADYRLPGWTGMDACRELRRLGFGIPLIVVTGNLGDERAVECVKEGANDYILKDQLARLPMAITRALDDQRVHQERAQAQQEALEREARFSSLADNIDEVFFVLASDYSETLYINPAYEKIWGRSRQSLYDNPRSFAEPVPADDRKRLLEYMARVQKGEQAGRIEFRVIQPGGAVRWLQVRAVPIRHERGTVYRIAGVALDITESREAQLALDESAERFRKLTETSFDAIDISENGLVYEANRGYLKMFGYERMDEVIGRPVAEFVAEESRAEVEQRVASHTEGTYEFVGQRKDGKKILLEATARTHTIAGRTVRITALRDVTERRALEDQFRQAQKMEAVGRLAGGVAHDFNNLLTVILSYTDMLLEGVSPKDPRADDLDQIRKAAMAAGSLTRQLLAFSRQQVIAPRLVDLNDIVASSQKMLGRLIGEDIQVDTTLASGSLTLMIDPGQLEQVIMNLAVNARDAMPNGGKLVLETATIVLDEEYARDHWPATPGHFAMLTVTDSGCGMDEQTRSRIFEPFFTTKGVGKGTGLGLATVYGIVKQSNGFIWVYSEPGKGTSFKIHLPLIYQAPEQYTGNLNAEAPRSGTETILLAEDAAAVRMAARQILERYGYTVLEAPNGTVALSTAQRTATIDLLLTDVVMPEMSGRELAEQFAVLRPDAKVLFMSGYTDDAIIRRAVLRPGAAYLQKPFSPETLARKVREVLDTLAPRNGDFGDVT